MGFSSWVKKLELLFSSLLLGSSSVFFRCHVGATDLLSGSSARAFLHRSNPRSHTRSGPFSHRPFRTNFTAAPTDIRQTLDLGRFDQVRGDPRLARHIGVEELQAVQIELDGAPGMRRQQIAELVGQLRLGERIDPVVKVVAGPANGAGVGLDGFRLQALELEMLEVGLIKAVEVRCGWRCHVS